MVPARQCADHPAADAEKSGQQADQYAGAEQKDRNDGRIGRVSATRTPPGSYPLVDIAWASMGEQTPGQSE